MKFYEYITESFDKPAHWRNIGNGLYKWSIDDIDYSLLASQHGNNTIMIEFSVDHGEEIEYELTGTGNEMKVFATVLDIIINDVIPSYNPREITFDSDKMQDNKSTNRTRLYTRLVKKFLPKGWKFTIDSGHPSYDVFMLEKIK